MIHRTIRGGLCHHAADGSTRPGSRGDHCDLRCRMALAGDWAGMRAIRVGTGEYAGQPDDPQPWLSCADFPAAAVAALLAGRPRAGSAYQLSVKYQ